MISAIKPAIEKAVLFSIAAVYIVQQLTSFHSLTPVIGSLVFMVIAFQLPKLEGMTRVLTVAFILIGAGILVVHKSAAWDWFEAGSVNVTIVILFLFAPLIGIPVRIPEYVDALKRFYTRNHRSKSGFFVSTQILTQIMGVFINVGSIAVVYELVFVNSQRWMRRFVINAMNRGFAGALFWSPYFAAMTLVTSALQVSWSSVLLYLFGLSMLSLVISWAVDFRDLARATVMSMDVEAPEKQAKTSFPTGLMMYLVAAIIVIFVLEQMIELPMVLLICLVAFLFPLVWCMGKKSIGVYRQGLQKHFTVTVPSLQKEITLFLAAGFFSGTIPTTEFGSVIPIWLDYIPLPIFFTFSVFTVGLIAGTSLLGLHPIVPVTILVGSVDPAVVQMSNVQFAVLLLASWGISNPISPASAVNNLLAGLLKKPVLEVTKPNYKFTGWMAIALIIYLMIGLSF